MAKKQLISQARGCRQGNPALSWPSAAPATALFGAEGAYTTKLSTVLKDNLDSIGGSLVKKTEGLNKQVSDLEKQLDALDTRMTRLSSLYTAQFTAMEMMVVQMQSSSSSLNSLLSSTNTNRN